MTAPRSVPVSIALTIGDPSGIGPELVLQALRDPELGSAMRLVVLGPGSLRPDSIECATAQDLPAALGGSSGHLWVETASASEWEMGKPQAQCGAASLEALRVGAELASRGAVDALVTAPVCKKSLHLAGEAVEGQTELLGRWADVPDVQMLAVAGQMRVLLLSRHMPLRDALTLVTRERVVEHLALLDRSLRQFGFGRRCLALAGLNPHAGEDGLLGSEEGAVLEPAAEEARGMGLDVVGPISPDTVFLRASRGEFDAVLALYHDQAFIPVKLAAPDDGFTVLCGLPYLRFSPAHGTAFDIAGKGVASTKGLFTALREAASWSRRRLATEDSQDEGASRVASTDSK